MDYVAGDFRDVLDTWHLGIQYSSLPTLNNAHVKTENQIRNADVFASTTYDTIYVIMNNIVKSRRIVTPRKPMQFQRV